MTTTSRRRFLLGTAALVAAASAPAITKVVKIIERLAPLPFIPCDGRELSVLDYPKLFATLGTRFGGDGLHFRIPDMRAHLWKGDVGESPKDEPFAALEYQLATGEDDIPAGLIFMRARFRDLDKQ